MKLKTSRTTIAITLALALAAPAMPAHAVTFINSFTVSGSARDLSGLANGANTNRLGGFGSDLIYDKASNQFYSLPDRGPGGGTIDYAPRYQAFKLGIDHNSGSISSFTLTGTTLFKDANNTSYTGLNPLLANGNVSTLGKSLDPEGLTRLPNGNFLVSDEYGPSVLEINAAGKVLRTFTTPANIIAKNGNALDYVNGRPTITSGRQDNRGFEGITVSADGKTAYAILQDPLVNEGAQNDGRRSRNVRIVAFDTVTGTSTSQFIYQLEDASTLNLITPGNTFSATSQGRNIGVSAIQALPDGRLLVLERDNRGFGPGDPTGTTPVAFKGLFVINLAGATDVSAISLAGSNALPNGVTAVSKTAYLDIRAKLLAAGITIGEKIEGMAFGPRLAGGGVSLILITDNDFSVTQNSSNVQFDVCTSGPGGTASEVILDSACGAGQSLIPTYLYSFRLDAAEARALGFADVPEPSSWAMMVAGFGLIGGGIRRARAARVAVA